MLQCTSLNRFCRQSSKGERFFLNKNIGVVLPSIKLLLCILFIGLSSKAGIQSWE